MSAASTFDLPGFHSVLVVFEFIDFSSAGFDRAEIKKRSKQRSEPPKIGNSLHNVSSHRSGFISGIFFTEYPCQIRVIGIWGEMALNDVENEDVIFP